MKTLYDEFEFVLKKAAVQIRIGDFKDFDSLYKYVTTQKESQGFSDIYIFQRCCELARVPFDGKLSFQNWKFDNKRRKTK